MFNYIERQKSIESNHEVPVMTNSFRDAIQTVRIIPAVGSFVSIGLTASDLLNSRLHSLMSISNILPSSDRKIKQILSIAIQEVAIHLEMYLNALEDIKSVNSLAAEAVVKVVAYLKTKNHNEIREITTEDFVSAILEQNKWFYNDRFLIRTTTESENYYFLTEEVMKKYSDESDIREIYDLIEANMNFKSSATISLDESDPIIELVRKVNEELNSLSEYKQIVVLYRNSIEFPFLRYITISKPIFDTDVDSLRLDVIEKQNRILQQKTINLSNQIDNNFDNVRGGIDSFIGRKEYLKSLYEYFSSNNGGIQVIGGLTGAGKTQTALKFINEHKEDYNYRVRWIMAEDESSLQKSFREFAEDLSLDVRKCSSQNIVKLVLDYLEKKSEKALLFFDNAIDINILKKYLPNQKSIKKHDIIVTTTNIKSWLDCSPARHNNIITIRPFSKSEAVEFVEKTLSTSPPVQIEKLSELFSYVPLGLSQSVAFIRSAEISIEAYLSEYEQKKQSLAHREMYDLSMEDEGEFAHMNNLYFALELTLGRVLSMHPEAYQIIRLCSYLRTESIPISLFNIIFTFESDRSRAISILKGFSLVTVMTNTNQYLETHGIIQEVIAMRMSTEDKIKDIEGLAHNIVQQGLFTRDNTTKQKYENNKKYLLHIESIIDNAQKHGIAFNPELIYLALSRAVYYDFSNDHLKAKKQLIDLKLQIKEIVHIEDDLSVEEMSFIFAKRDKRLPTLYAQICYHLGKSYLSLSQELAELGQYDEYALISSDAKKELEEAVAIREIVDTSQELYDDIFNEGITRPMDSTLFKRQGILLWHKLQKKEESTELAIEGYRLLIKKELGYAEGNRDNFNLETCRRLLLECMNQKIETDTSQDPSVLYGLLENIAVNLGIIHDQRLAVASYRNLFAERIFEALESKTQDYVRVAREYNFVGKIFLKIYIITQKDQDIIAANMFVERAKILEESISQKSFILSDANKILDQINNLKNKVIAEKIDFVNSGDMVTGEQITTIMQIMTENSGAANVDFTASITEENIDSFVERLSSPEEILKVHFGAINIHSDNDQDNNHWVSYVQVPNIDGISGEVDGVRSIIINSAGSGYSLSLGRIKSKIENIFLNKQIHITIQERNLEYQTRDFELHKDWNTCGIWVCQFFEELLLKIASLSNPGQLNFDEILSYININEKRKEYTDLLKALDFSVKIVADNEKRDDVFYESKTKIDETLTSIDVAVSSSERKFRENSLISSEHSRELLEIIKQNSYPPILGHETLEEEKIRYEKLVSSFAQLGEIFIHRVEEATLIENKINALIESGKFLNYAINIARMHSIDSGSSYSILEYINSELIFLSGGTTPPAQSALTNALRDNSEKLELRDFVREKLVDIEKSLSDEDKIIKTRDLFENIAKRMKGFLARLFKENEAILGEPPCKYSVMGLGSMAVKTITPYSDLEFAIIIEKDSQEIKEYFKKLTQLVHFRIINLGETVIPESDLGGCNTDHLMKKGVSFDLGGKTPLGRKDKSYDLIQTIDGMLHYLRNEEEKIEHIDKNLPYILEVSDYVYGDIELHRAYVEQAQRFIFEELNSVGVPNHEARAIKRLKGGIIEFDDLSGINNAKLILGDIEAFNPENIATEVQGKFFDAKQEIYRLPDRLIYGLSLLYKIHFNSPWDAVNQLEIKGIINSEHRVVDKLQKIISYAVCLRLKVYLYNNSQKDEVHLFDVNAINSIQVQNEQEVSNFVDLTIKEGGLDTSSALHDNYKKEVRQLYIRYHSMDPLFHKDNTALLNKGFTFGEKDLAEDGALFKFYYISIPFHRILKQLIDKYNDLNAEARNRFFIGKNLFNDDDIVKSLIHIRFGNFFRAVSYLEKADSEISKVVTRAIQTLDMNSNSYIASQEFINKVVFVLSALADSYCKIGKYSKSVEVQLRLIEILEYLSPDDNKFMAGALENIASSYFQIKDYSKSIEYHLKSLEIKQKIYDGASEKIAQSLSNIAIIYREIGDYNFALNYLIKSKQIYENKYKLPNVAVINCLANMANVLLSQAKYNEAIELYDRSFEIALSLYKSSIHPLVSKILNNLGMAYQEMGLIDKAVSCYVRCYQINKIIYGDKPHILVIMSLEKLGSIHSENGNFNLSENYILQAMKMRMSLPDLDYGNIASSYFQLAQLYYNKGNLNKAMEYLNEAIELKEQVKIPGRDFPLDYSKFLNFQGVIYENQCNFPKALEVLFKALQISKAIHESETHPDVVQSLCNIAMVYSEMENYDQAIEYYNKALKMQEYIYGSVNHPNIVKNLNGIANIYAKINENNKAIEIYKKALEIQNQIYGLITPVTNFILNNLAAAYANNEDLEEAYSILSKNIEQLKDMYNGEMHSSVANAYSNLGSFFFKKKEFYNAIEKYNRALEIQKELHKGVMHLNIASILGNIGEVYLANGEYIKSITYYLQSLEIKRKIYKNNMHIDIAKILNNLGAAFYKTGKIEEAIESFQESLEIKSKFYSNGIHKEVSSTLINLGSLFLGIKKFDESIKYYEMALKIERELGDEKNTINISNILNNLGEACREIGDYTKAVDYGLECLARKKAIFEGIYHEEVAASLNNIGNAYSRTNPELALSYYIQSLEIKQKISSIPNEEIVHTLINISRIYILKDDYDSALQYFFQSIEALEAIYNNGIHQNIVLCLVHVAGIYNKRKDFEKSLQYIIQAHEINNKLYNAPHDEITKTLNYLGEAYLELKIFDKGIKSLTDSLEMRKELYKSMHHPDVRLALKNLGVAYRKFIEHYKFSPFAIIEAGMAHVFSKYDFTDYKLHYDKAISFYQDGCIGSAIDEFRMTLIFIPTELKSFYSFVSHQLAIAYLTDLSNKSNDEQIDYAEYYNKIESAFKEAIEYSSQVDASLRIDYARFLIVLENYLEAAEQLLKVIISKEVFNDNRENIIGIPNIIDDEVVREQYAYNLILMNYERISEVVRLENFDFYLDSMIENINLNENVRGYFLLEEVLRKLGRFEECSKIVAKVAELELRKLIGNENIEEQDLSEDDAKEFEIILNLLLDYQEELEAGTTVSAGGDDKLLERIDGIKAFLGEAEISEFPGFNQYVFNALSNNRFSESATKILSMFSSLISSLEKLMDLSLLFSNDEELKENSDIGTSIWTQLQYLLEFTASGQRFIGVPPRPPYFDPDEDGNGGGSSGGGDIGNNTMNTEIFPVAVPAIGIVSSNNNTDI